MICTGAYKIKAQYREKPIGGCSFSLFTGRKQVKILSRIEIINNEMTMLIIVLPV